MNSFLRTPKLIKFNKLINVINTRYGTNLNKYPVQSQDLGKDA
jgi:hypothetical protein